MRIVTKRLRCVFFHYKVALYLSYLHIEFDDEIRENPSEFQEQFASKVKLTSRLGYIRSQMSQLLGL